MKRYVTRAADMDRSPDAEAYLARTVFEADKSPQPTGLLDWTGAKIYSIDASEPIGFIRRE